MKRLAIIYGSPRTGTSFLHECLCSHEDCAGSDKTSEPESRYGILPSVKNMDVFQKLVDVLWNEHCENREEYLVMKSPGFCSDGEYRALKGLVGYDCRFIHTTRLPASVIDSMLLHKISKNVLGIVIEGTDCPKEFLSLYKPLWDKVGDDDAGLINKGFMRVSWYLKSISSQQIDESLVLKYEDRVKHAVTSKKIEQHLGISHDSGFQKKMGEFDYLKSSTDRIKFIKNSIIPELAEDFKRA